MDRHDEPIDVYDTNYESQFNEVEGNEFNGPLFIEPPLPTIKLPM